jgi:hypothetical protein
MAESTTQAQNRPLKPKDGLNGAPSAAINVPYLFNTSRSDFIASSLAWMVEEELIAVRNIDN